MYGGCYPNTIRFLKNRGIKTSYSCMMHERKISIEEHEKYFGTYPFPHVKDDILWSMYIGGIKEADIVITPGSAPKKSLIKEGSKRVEIIPHGCNIPPEYKIDKTRLTSQDKFNIGYLGAYGPDKGLVYLIKAWEMLNYNDSILIFAGNQTEYLEPFIRQYANTGRYHILGYVKDVGELYNRCSVYVQPSVTEAFGMEVIEAMSYGHPVIVSYGAGSADCVRDGVDGFVVSAMDIKAIADKVQYFKDNTSEIERMGKNAREKSLDYSWDKIKKRYIDLWRSLLNE